MRYMISLSYVFGERGHVLLEVVIGHSRVMAIEVVVFVFGAVWVIGRYLEWAMSGLSIDSSICVI